MASSSHNSIEMQHYLRGWRQNELNKSQYISAIFVGDKLLSLSEDAKDAFWLAQVHFTAGNYEESRALLEKYELLDQLSCKYLAAHCYVKQARYEDALVFLGEQDPTHLILKSAKRRFLETGSRASRQDKPAQMSEDELSDRRYEASMCYLRGQCYAKQNAFDRAKDSYKNAVLIDPQCFEAFSELTKNALVSAVEGRELVDEIECCHIQAEGDEDLGGDDNELTSYTKMLYHTQLPKFYQPSGLETAIKMLTSFYGLEHNADILLARADLLHTQCRFEEALEITNFIINTKPYNFAAYPLHVSCLYELRKTNPLQVLAHRLAADHPDQPCTYYAVGSYYFLVGDIPNARGWFSKASTMDVNFGPAWIGFAHTFAAEGEHDQAISAYSTAARLFQGSHLPQVFLGMQHHAMNNMTAAEEFLKVAYDQCQHDPLLLNEMGVTKYHQGRLKESITLFKKAINVACDIGSAPRAWLGARTNLGHAYRRLRRFEEALREFDFVMREGGRDSAIFCARAIIYMDLGRIEEAIVALHEALSISPQDPMGTELLNRALDEFARKRQPRGGEDELQGFEVELAQRKVDANAKVNGPGRRAGRPAKKTAGRGRPAKRNIQGKPTDDSLANDEDEAQGSGGADDGDGGMDLVD